MFIFFELKINNNIVRISLSFMSSTHKVQFSSGFNEEASVDSVIKIILVEFQ